MATAMMASSTLSCSTSLLSVSSRVSSGRQLRSSVVGLPQLSARRHSQRISPFTVRAEAPLPETKVTPTNNDEQVKVFEDTPAGKFARPESERRPEAGNTDPASVMKFDGPAPETINGRLAMIGMVWAFVAEINSGQTVAEQSVRGGLIYFLAIVPIFIWASLVPIFGWNESPDSRAFGPFNAKAERWNGRAAMIGFVALLFTENVVLKGPLLGFLGLLK